MTALKPFAIPTVTALIGMALLIFWAYDNYGGWGKFVLGGGFLVAGLYGVSEAAEARKDDES
jgi:hypothetical protein